jgi:hypothetical protein
MTMRTIIIASLLAFTVAGTAYAADDSLDKAAKKTGENFGELLKGMGQEVKKTGIGDQKKDDKKASKSGESPSKEDKK